MKKTIIAFLLFLPLRAIYSQENLDSLRNSPRVVKTCIAVDSQYPVRKDFLKITFQTTVFEFREKVGIDFEMPETVNHDGNFERDHFEQLLYLIRICPPEFELAMIFTNRDKIYRYDESVLGENASSFGYIVLYGFSQRFLFVKDSSGIPTPITTLKHEIGHMFGLRHSEARQSFMYPYPMLSFGKWTSEIVETILKNKWKKWTPFQRWNNAPAK